MNNKRKIVWAGDSTVARNSFASYPQTGMGQGFLLYIKQNITLLNLAVNGRSTKSFIDEQRMPEAYFALQEGDFFFIQFGHNDQKKEDPLRYEEAFGGFQVNLEKFANVARNRGAQPVFITPLVRRHFKEDGTLMPSHGDYPQAMRELAEKMDVPLIDMQALSEKYVEALGPERSRLLYMNFPAGLYENYPAGLEDNTHLTAEGARQYAGLLAAALWERGEPFRGLLLEECGRLPAMYKTILNVR